MPERLPSTSPLTPGLIVWILGVTQIVGYGTLYYSFAILAGDMAAAFGWPVSWIFAAFSLALLAGGFAAPFAGRWIDVHGAPRIMAWGSAGSAAALLIFALAPTVTVWVIALFLAQIASSFVLYNAAFACLAQTTGSDANRRITHLTLIAGFASTLFWPLTTWMRTVFDWQIVYAIFAASHLFICLPAHLYLARGFRAVVSAESGPSEEGGRQQPAIAPSRQFRALVLITLGFSLSGFLLSAILAQMVPVLVSLGLGGASVMVSTLFGPAQVLVRFANLTAGTGRHPLTVTMFAALMLPLAVVVLALTAPWAAGAMVFLVLLGFGSGLKSIVQGTLPLALFGREGYGRRLGNIASVQFVSSALAPSILTFLIEAVGPRAALAVLVVVALGGLAAFAALRPLIARQE